MGREEAADHLYIKGEEENNSNIGEWQEKWHRESKRRILHSAHVKEEAQSY